ncbi:MAG: hypothetical protein ACI9H1_000188 [Polaribacter sp.]|jgi:hypothetical protein|tara:strand:- start:268 stop:459 length:192 start_codon:yes stop_codon:yes gene_type:complete
MIKTMAIETLPSWKALNKDYPRKDFSQESNYIVIAVAAILITSLAAVLIVNYQNEKSLEENKV